jgi:chaperonin cofactor prefoldin
MNYHGKLYGKVGNKYAELGVGTEYVDSLKDKKDALEEQTSKLQADKDRLAKLLEQVYSKIKETGLKPPPAILVRIKTALSECGYNI